MPQIMSPILICHIYYHLWKTGCATNYVTHLGLPHVSSPKEDWVCHKSCHPSWFATYIITQGRLGVPQNMSPILVCHIYYHLWKTGCATNHVTHLGLPHVLSPKTGCATNHVAHLSLHMHYHQRKIVCATNHVTHLGLPHILSPKEDWGCHKSCHPSWFATYIIT